MALADYSQPTWSITPEQGQQLNSVAFDAPGRNIFTGTSQEYGKTSVDVFCYNTDGKSATLSWSQTIATDVDSGTFWVAMSPIGNYCAAAGHTASDNGYIYIYDVVTGDSVGSFTSFTSRVNEIEFTGLGDQFIAVQGANVILGKNTGGVFNQETTTPSAQAYMRTCSTSTNDTWAVAAGGVDGSGDTSSTGIICTYENVSGTFTYKNTITTTNEILRIAMIDDGKYFAATDNAGHVYLYSTESTTPLWSYTPAYSCDLTYAAAIAYNSNQEVMVAVGTNISVTSTVQSEASKAFQVQPGLVYVLKNVADSSQPSGYTSAVQWQQRIEYPPNPGLNFDAQAKYVTCATGQPYDTLNETIGSFYLFDGATGFQYWRYDTSIMSWPMQINAEATACIGGSDNGTLYYWGLPVQS